MPEGDTLLKIARAMSPRLVGERIVCARLHRRPVPSWEREVSRVWNVGKHLLIELAEEDDLAAEVIRTHLGLHGSWHGYSPGEAWRKAAWRAAVEIETKRDVFVCFDAKEVESLPASSALDRSGGPRNEALARLGPDILTDAFDPRVAARRARELLSPDTAMVDVLLDQRVVSGIGNVYKNEVLFLERRHPRAALADMTQDDLTSAFERAGKLMQKNVGPELAKKFRTTTGDRWMRGDAPESPSLPKVSQRLWVYSRTDEPCFRCSTPIEWARPGKRRRDTWWCPSCQAHPRSRN